MKKINLKSGQNVKCRIPLDCDLDGYIEVNCIVGEEVNKLTPARLTTINKGRLVSEDIIEILNNKLNIKLSKDYIYKFVGDLIPDVKKIKFVLEEGWYDVIDVSKKPIYCADRVDQHSNSNYYGESYICGYEETFICKHPKTYKLNNYTVVYKKYENIKV